MKSLYISLLMLASSNCVRAQSDTLGYNLLFGVGNSKLNLSNIDSGRYSLKNPGVSFDVGIQSKMYSDFRFMLSLNYSNSYYKITSHPSNKAFAEKKSAGYLNAEFILSYQINLTSSFKILPSVNIAGGILVMSENNFKGFTGSVKDNHLFNDKPFLVGLGLYALKDLKIHNSIYLKLGINNSIGFFDLTNRKTLLLPYLQLGYIHFLNTRLN